MSLTKLCLARKKSFTFFTVIGVPKTPQLFLSQQVDFLENKNVLAPLYAFWIRTGKERWVDPRLFFMRY
jgi:hypothetical protein